MARFRHGAFPGGNPWQVLRSMHPESGLGRENCQFVARFARHASEMSWLWQDMRAMYPKSPANRRRRMHHVNILPGRSLFAAQTPRIMHDARILPFLGVSFGSCGRGEGRGGARGVGAAHAARARPPPLCARRRGAFVGSSHAALSCPRSRARCSCCCACSRVRRARCPLLREARTFRGALCEVSAFASRRWVCLSPFTRRLCLVRSFRGGARC